MASIAAIRCSNGSQQGSELKREWDTRNAPERMGLVNDSYEVEFSKLPNQGSLSRIPWSGDYWPTYKGGLTYRWAHSSRADKDRIYYDTHTFDSLSSVDISQLSPAEKYDIFTGDHGYSMTKAERKRTNVFKQLSGEKIPTWFGLCHAWAPATLMYPNPGPVDLKGATGVQVKFGSSDIKALLTLYLNDVSSPNYFVSRRCNVDDKELRKKLDAGQITRAQFDEAMSTADCRGINAGAYHIILANMISLRDQGFIADVTRGAEVWNQAVSGYKTRVVQQRTQVSTQAAPGTVKEVLVETVMTYTHEIAHSWDRVQIPQSNKTVVYKYWLELDKEDSIVGGLWVSEKRPDFLWRRERPSPEFQGKWAALSEIVKAATQDVAPDGGLESGPDGDNDEASGVNHPPAGSAGGNIFIVGQPRWRISKFMFTYLIDLDIEVSGDVDSVVLETVKHDGSVHKQHVLKRLRRRPNHFRLRNLPVAQWKAGAMNVFGYSKSGKKLFTFAQNYTR